MDIATPTTLDEPVSATIMRDARAVFSKLKIVLLPSGYSSPGNLRSYDADAALKELKDWDLWGPLFVCLSLSILLSVSAGEQGPLVFSAVFFVVWSGAAIVTINAQLLGGTISFFQSVCVLGYCIFPLTIAAVFVVFFRLFVTSVILDLILVALGFVWGTRASVVFIGQFIEEERKLLATFPVFFFYLFLAWMIML